MKYGKFEYGDPSPYRHFSPYVDEDYRPAAVTEAPVEPTMPPYYLTAYGIARKNGYSGTEEEWLQEFTAEIERRVLIMFIKHGQPNEYYGTSSDAKPTLAVPAGSIFVEVDTGDVYMYNETSSSWVYEFSLQA